ncbi:hypothetical protein E2C01_089850 [Portunus trituberculatus]|uniref:Uncharacterized protein n=1 Tax=Portunus trituberculatus TaxID=210409 RepID=A0A5B7J9Y0_PORTR|nr:hypothetical protein [Portunus trituberculatus]
METALPLERHATPEDGASLLPPWEPHLHTLRDTRQDWTSGGFFLAHGLDLHESSAAAHWRRAFSNAAGIGGKRAKEGGGRNAEMVHCGGGLVMWLCTRLSVCHGSPPPHNHDILLITHS